MEVITIESSVFQQLRSMFSESCQMVERLSEENKSLKTKTLLTSQQVAEITGFNEQTIRKRKHEIGFVSFGATDIRFKSDRVQEWIDQLEIKPRAKRKH